MKDFSAISKRFFGFVKRYGALFGVWMFQVPLHEGLHALAAIILPHVQCKGIVLSSSYWYSDIFSVLSFGFIRSEAISDGVAGYAQIMFIPTWIGNIGQAIVSAAPEVATMVLGFYWIRKAMLSISSSGMRIYSVISSYVAMGLLSVSFHYLTTSSLSPEPGQDHYGFTNGIMNLFYLPDGLTGFVTFIGAALMTATALLIANKLPDKQRKESEPKPQF